MVDFFFNPDLYSLEPALQVILQTLLSSSESFIFFFRAHQDISLALSNLILSVLKTADQALGKTPCWYLF